MTNATTTSLGSTREVTSAIDQLGLPKPSREAILAISKACRDAFIASLGACLEGNDGQGEHRRRLEQTLLCVSEATGSALAALGHQIAVEDRALIALSRPQRFLSALGVAADPAHPRQTEAKAFLDGYLGTRGWCAGAAEPPPSPAPADPVPAEAPPTGTPASHSGNSPEGPSAGAIVPSSVPAADEDPATILVHGASTVVRFQALAESQPRGCLRIEQARAIAPRVDWEHALCLVLEPRQIAACLAVLRRWRGPLCCEAPEGHSAQAFVLVPSGNRFRCAIQPAKEGARVPRLGVSLGREEAFSLAVLFLQQLMLARPGMSANEILEHVRAAHSASLP